jgi:hypothetical protein
MRSSFFLAILCTASMASVAQFQKHTRIIGASIAAGSFGAGTTEYTYPAAQGFKVASTNYNFSLTPSYGVFISERTSIGASLLLNYAHSRIENKTLQDTTYKQDKSTNTDLGLGLFLRQYFSNGKNLLPFAHVYVNGGTGFGSTSGFNYTSDQLGAYKDVYSGKISGKFFFNTGINIGVTKMLGSATGLDLFAGYFYSYTKYSSATDVNRDYSNTQPDLTLQYQPTQKFTGSGLNVGIGLQFFLQPRK